MDEQRLVEKHPQLWHIAEDGSWPTIRRHGLLSTRALLDLHGITGSRRAALEGGQRRQCETIEGRGLPPAILRDQKPMPPRALSRCLDDGLVPADWYRLLNARCFFWLSETRLQGMLATYGDRPHVVLTVDTASLVGAHRERIELSRINSGYALRTPARRGRSTFRSIAAYEHQGIVELSVVGGVPDVARHVLAVERRHRERVLDVLWRRDL
jgi:hypothetical protein